MSGNMISTGMFVFLVIAIITAGAVLFTVVAAIDEYLRMVKRARKADEARKRERLHNDY